MQKVLTAEQMREVDRLTTEVYGIPSILLMENAAHGVARVISEKLGGSVRDKTFFILCGKGNNGGDGAALARILWSLGADVHVYLFGKIEDTKGDARVNFEILKKMMTADSRQTYPRFWDEADGVNIEEITTDIELTPKIDVVVDALFGTGLTRPMTNELAGSLDVVHNFFHYKDKPMLRVSVDLPSGLDADKYEPVGYAERWDVTVTFTAPKLANVFPPASNNGGELVTINIGSPGELIDQAPSKIFAADRRDALDWIGMTDYSSDSYKNKRGHALLVAGSEDYAGAAALAGNAAMISGVGLTTIATSKSAHAGVAAKALEEVIVRELSETNGAIGIEAAGEVEKLSEKVDVVGIGPGLNAAGESARNFVREVVEKRRTPMVIDADGLNSLAPFDLNGSDDLPLILTPHEGEFIRLFGAGGREALTDRFRAVSEFAVKHNVIVVLKGERVLIAGPDGRVVINPTGNSGLGKAGNGDTLTGIITGFIAQTMPRIESALWHDTDLTPVSRLFRTVVAAVYFAGLAGDIAERKYGKRTMLASDVRDCLAEAFREVAER